MKVERCIREPKLWKFVLNNLPESLEGFRQENGYGETYSVELKEPKKNVFDWSFRRSTIAIIGESSIELFHPQYFSDIEDIVRNYEGRYNKQVLIKLWEDP